jgi:hypothetical protein
MFFFYRLKSSFLFQQFPLVVSIRWVLRITSQIFKKYFIHMQDRTMAEIPNGGEGLWREVGWYEAVINMHVIAAGLDSGPSIRSASAV